MPLRGIRLLVFFFQTVFFSEGLLKRVCVCLVNVVKQLTKLNVKFYNSDAEALFLSF